MNPDSIVHSWPEETPASVLNQRLRWGSGGMSYSPAALRFALSTFLFFVSLLISPFLWLSGLISTSWIAFAVLKIVQESRVMLKGWKVFKLTPDWAAFFLLQLIHIPAILTFSIVGHLWGFRWKGQRFTRTRKPKYKISRAPNQ